jgi:hypothetical protein
MSELTSQLSQLVIAAESGDADSVRTCLDNGCDINEVETNPVFLAAPCTDAASFFVPIFRYR